MELLALLIGLCIARYIIYVDQKQKLNFKSDDDLFQRYIVYTHRKLRKDKGLKPLY